MHLWQVFTFFGCLIGVYGSQHKAGTPPAPFLGCINMVGQVAPFGLKDYRWICAQREEILQCLVDKCAYGSFMPSRDHFLGVCLSLIPELTDNRNYTFFTEPGNGPVDYWQEENKARKSAKSVYYAKTYKSPAMSHTDSTTVRTTTTKTVYMIETVTGKSTPRTVSSKHPPATTPDHQATPTQEHPLAPEPQPQEPKQKPISNRRRKKVGKKQKGSTSTHRRRKAYKVGRLFNR